MMSNRAQHRGVKWMQATHSHCKPVIESQPADVHWPTQRGHAADVLGNGHTIGEQGVNEIVGEHKVAASGCIFSAMKRFGY
jgi:hypothetical protein